MALRSIAVRLRGGALVLGPVAIMVLLVLYPLAAIVIQSVLPDLFALVPDLHFSTASLQAVLSTRASYQALLTTSTLGVVTAALAALIGTTTAVIARRTDMPGARLVTPLVWIIFFTPSFMEGEAWTILMLRGGTLDHIVPLPDRVISTFFSPVGVALLLALKGFPFVHFSVSAALTWLGSEYEEAARISGARLGTAWWRVNLPLLVPAIATGALIVFAETIADFGTAATIANTSHMQLVTYAIYRAINSFPVDFSRAAGLSLLLFIAITLPLVLQGRIGRSRIFQVISSRTRPAHRLRLGSWRWPALGFVALVALLAFALPVCECILLSFMHAFGNGFAAGNFSLVNYRDVLADTNADQSTIFTSTKLAFGAATAVTLIGLPVAFLIMRTEIPGRAILNWVTLATIAVPGIILASGYIFAWNSPYLQNLGLGGPRQPHFYGTIWILLTAYIGGSLPYAVRLGMGALSQVSDSLIESARVHGAGIVAVLTRIIGPIMRGSLASIFLLVFTATMFELPASELLYPPGQPTMPVRIQKHFADFLTERGMALAMIDVSFVAGVALLLGLAPSLITRVRRSLHR